VPLQRESRRSMIPFQLHRRIPLIRRPFYQRDQVTRERDQASRERDQALADLKRNEQIGQVLLRLQYQDLARRGSALPEFSDIEFSCYSQSGEDGILLYIFSLLGTTNRRAVEICAGSGAQCNTANLIINHSWQGLLFDGDADLIAQGRAFYSACRATSVAPPTLVAAWITVENIDDLVVSNGFGGQIDLLSLDLDGNDYWIWKALTCVEPRVVILEFNTSCGPQASLAMSYQPDYRLDMSAQINRCGASLPAFVKLGKTKGYRLVGIQSLGFNAFFVRNGTGDDLLPEVSAEECFQRNDRLRYWMPGMLDVVLAGDEAWEAV
jgi:hypothetical protein